LDKLAPWASTEPVDITAVEHREEREETRVPVAEPATSALAPTLDPEWWSQVLAVVVEPSESLAVLEGS
jgi:hypothetical protein